jgi:sterol 24-C-methyltransferase
MNGDRTDQNSQNDSGIELSSDTNCIQLSNESDESFIEKDLPVPKTSTKEGDGTFLQAMRQCCTFDRRSIKDLHFGPRLRNETLLDSIKRADQYLCYRLEMKPGMRVLDVGCGIGDPMRDMAKFSGSNIEGISINARQVKTGNGLHKSAGLAHLCKSVQGDFQRLTWPNEHFDAAYDIEALCHSPDRVVTFTGINRVLKKGGLFAGYDWVLTDKYDPKNRDHVRIKEGIEVGYGLPTLNTAELLVKCLEKSGFEVVDHYDANRGAHAANEIPWYDRFIGRMSYSGIRRTEFGRRCARGVVSSLEAIYFAPSGSTRVFNLVEASAVDMLNAGREEIFTPSYFFLARKK